MESKLEIIRASRAWIEICNALEEGVRPHAIVLRADESLHHECSMLFPEMFLCDGFRDKEIGENNKDLVHGGVHPDLILSGDAGSAPGIDRCREITAELAVKPVAGPGRVAVIFSAHKLSLPASNSLLKVTEEPPEGAVIIFLLSPNGNIIPTLSSRSWCFSIPMVPEKISMALPANDAEWMGWLAKNDKRNVEDIIDDLEMWINFLFLKKEHLLAARLEGLKMIGSRKRLTKTMLQDLILFVVKEGIPFEHIPGDFW